MRKKKKELTDEEIEELDGYLQYEFNHDVYEELTDKDDDYFGLFEPLEFFRLFYDQVAFIEEHKAKPLFVSRNLQKLNLSDEQLYIICEKLINYFDDEKGSDEALNVCCREISKIKNKLNVFDDEDESEETDPYDFDAVLEHLKSLPTYGEKIAYLVKQKYEYDQKFGGSSWSNPSFTRSCRLEIEKLEKLAKLQSASQPKATEAGKHQDLTLDRATLFMNYLLAFSKANCHNTKKAEVISFLTGYSKNTIGDKLSALHSKADDNFVAYEKDMKIVRKYFESLGLSEIVKMIDRDLKE